MARPRIQPVPDWLKRVVTQPRDELTRWQKALRFGYDLGRCGARQLRQDRAPQMAAALSFRTLFGLLPVMVVATVLARALMGPEEFSGFLGRTIGAAIDRLGLTDLTIGRDVVRGDEASHQTLGEFLNTLMAPVADLRLAALGWVGLVVVIYAAISLMVTIEKSFNAIYRAPEGRPWVWRISMYWTVLTVSPLALTLTLYLDRRFDTMMDTVETWQWVLVTTNVLWSFLAAWLFMTVVYKLVPNTSVRLRPAMAGAFVAAVLLEIGKRTLGAYLANAVSMSLLYGSLGLIPLFMFWVYLMWLVVLFGLEVSATLQMLAGRRVDELEQQRQPTGLVDPASILTVMEVIGRRFSAAQPATARELAEATGVAEATVRMMLGRLIEAGLLHRLDREDEAVTLARPPEKINADELIELGYALVEGGGMDRKSLLMQKLREAQHALATQVTLAGLLEAPAPAAGTDKVPPP